MGIFPGMTRNAPSVQLYTIRNEKIVFHLCFNLRLASCGSDRDGERNGCGPRAVKCPGLSQRLCGYTMGICLTLFSPCVRTCISTDQITHSHHYVKIKQP